MFVIMLQGNFENVDDHLNSYQLVDMTDKVMKNSTHSRQPIIGSAETFTTAICKGI